jgi:ketosteroid isomerase-like protein
MDEIVKLYFKAWKTQDASLLPQIFASNAVYKVKPFGIEQYRGIDEIKSYWESKPVALQVSPRPKALHHARNDKLYFVEWENRFTTLEGTHKITEGILVLEFQNGLVSELREFYLSSEL